MQALAHIHERIANRRADFAHRRSRDLVNTYQLIVFEDLAPLEMGRSRGMRKSILDVAWSQFVSMTVAKAEEAVRRVVLVNPPQYDQAVLVLRRTRAESVERPHPYLPALRAGDGT